MKKISIALSALMMLGVTACDSDDINNVLEMPGENSLHLEVPGNLDQQWYLEKDGTFDLTTNKANYGNVGPVLYGLEVALEESFENNIVLTPADNSTPEMSFRQKDLNAALCELKGIDYENYDEDDAAVGVYMRAYSNLSNNLSTQIYSEAIHYTDVVIYRPSPETTGEPTGIYLRGGMNGWGAEPDYEFLTTDDATITMVKNVTIPLGTEFKVADADWGAINLGGVKDGDAEERTVQPDSEEAFILHDNGDNIIMGADFTGNVSLIYERGEYKLQFTVTDSSVGSGIYIRGGMNGWGAEKNWEFSAASSFVNEWIIDGVIISAGEEFKIADADWGAINLGCDPGDGLKVGESYVLEAGGPNMKLAEDFVGSVILTLDNGVYSVKFEAHQTGIYLRGGMNGWGAEPAWEFHYTSTPGTYIIENVTIDGGTEFKCADPDWANINLGYDGEEPFQLNKELPLTHSGSNIIMPETATVDVILSHVGEDYTIELKTR